MSSTYAAGDVFVCHTHFSSLASVWEKIQSATLWVCFNFQVTYQSEGGSDEASAQPFLVDIPRKGELK